MKGNENCFPSQNDLSAYILSLLIVWLGWPQKVIVGKILYVTLELRNRRWPSISDYLQGQVRLTAGKGHLNGPFMFAFYSTCSMQDKISLLDAILSALERWRFILSVLSESAQLKQVQEQ